ncbi:hypothetical protein H4P1_00057 (plasmid) [Variovorax sp. PBS-H4]|uniref:HEAT repeat domain-containing protein n=1 Tax=Variovorax sp. PBS-H4 TaxID=434008 RepID=UPI001318DBC8|nr:HEAT repeat domain-containing protein [Variovorax sp. PBS-H4]VTU41425.1 hypothetical protein H4P1_00057 [Variovorax sp. PBS-H4]
MVSDFVRGMAMMRKHDPQTQEDGFGLVKRVAAEHADELVVAHSEEADPGLRNWLLELLVEAQSPEALPIFARALELDATRHWGEAGLLKLNTKEARAVLWRHGQNQF